MMDGHRTSERVDTRAKVMGAAAYVEDLPDLPGMVYAAPLHSPYAHARIRSIDSSAAERLPGVLAVFDRARLGRYGVTLAADDPLDPASIAVERARFEGDLLALVVAENHRTARRAVELIDVDYELLPPVFSAEESLAAGAPLLHEGVPGNMVFADQFEWGDVDEGFRQAERVFEEVFGSPTIFHHPMEPIGTGLVIFADGIARIWAPTNTPMRDARDVGRFLGIRPENVHLRVPVVGGGFGAKKVTREMTTALAVSRALGRPIKLVATGGESFQVAVRHAMTYKGKMGLTADGRIIALDVEILVDCGAYFTGRQIATHNACISAWGCYRIPHFRARALTAFTNKTPATPHRGTGKTQTTYAVEAFVDSVARQMAIDPLEFRRTNVLLRGERIAEKWKVRGEEVPARTPILDIDFPALTDQVLATLEAPTPLPSSKLGGGAGGEGESPSPLAGEGWGGGVPPRTAGASSNLRRGRGVALSLRHASKGDEDSTAMAMLEADGTVRISHNATDLGQGVYNMLSIVASRTLGLPMDQIVVEQPDTSNHLSFPGVASQRTTIQMGKAVYVACESLKSQILDLAVEAHGGDLQAWRLEEGRLWRDGDGMTLGELLRSTPGVSLSAIGTDTEPAATDRAFGGFDHWAPGVAAAEVEVDTDTGEVRVLQYSVLADAGEVLHYPSARGQLEGGAVMGVGIALCEELVYGEGQTLNADAFQYRLPQMGDIPEVFRTTILESGDGPGPFGSKGVAQTSIPCVAPAVANAIADATGAIVRATPFTPDRVLRALGKL